MSRTNKVILIGRVGKDIETKPTSAGGSVGSFSFATEDSYKGKDNKYHKTSEWHSCTAYGPIAESMSKHCKKGTALIIEGHLKTSSWDDKNGGGKRYKTEVIVETWIFQQSGNAQPSVGDAETTSDTPAVDSQDIDSDLPF